MMTPSKHIRSNYKQNAYELWYSNFLHFVL